MNNRHLQNLAGLTNACQDLPPFLQDSLQTKRQQAWQQLQQTGFPTRKTEDWCYTSVRNLLAQDFDLNGSSTHCEINDKDIPTGEYYPIVFKGHELQPELTHLPANCVIKTFQQLINDNEQKRIDKFFNHEQTTSFASLNQASLQNGLFIKIPDNTIIDKPIHIIVYNCANSMQHLRHVVIAKPHSQVKIIETYVGPKPHHYFNNVYSELYLSDNAHVEHYKIIHEGPLAYHHSHLNAYLARDSHLTAYSIANGGQWVRADVSARLQGENSECQLFGLFTGKKQQHIDHHTTIEHQVAHTHSREFYKGVIDDEATGVFNGKVIVAPDAQQVQSQQLSNNLLLSPKADINTKPELEIYADDVKCQHGATVGQLDQQALFYLQARGIEQQAAHRMLVQAFAHDIIRQLPLTSLRDYLLQQEQSDDVTG